MKLYGVLRHHRPEDGGLAHHPFIVTLPSEATVAELVTHLVLPDGLVAGVAVNGETAVLHTPLHSQDKISFFPPTAGG